ncbi:hypothetical protein CCY99_08870 [Helicobacter sp. 16-1353]|uniref:phospholipase D-like domain-containing protein n=1 Tax=Helicobacter sp. 16-1353 TaxID=2004996 RepID=UPI000DCB7241|nr:phospholipase D-like domain-containing protein [Helicobacter sp. 16-1353]RAX51563.1 hypothetical protein CCY99_08870 [Helicobacter sp. 16-1353]
MRGFKAVIVGLCVFSGILMADSIFTMPSESKEALEALKAELKGAKTSVNIAVFDFTHDEILEAIRESAKNGVKYNVILDSKRAKDKDSVAKKLKKIENVNLCKLEAGKSKRGHWSGKMHNKFAIIDGKTAIFGSANWSKAAFGLNYEFLIFSQNAEYINALNDFFGEMSEACGK